MVVAQAALGWSGCRAGTAASGTAPAHPLPATTDSAREDDGQGGPDRSFDDEPGLPYGEDEQRTVVQRSLAHPSTYRAPQGPNIVRFEDRAVLLEPDVAAAVERAAAELPPELGLVVVEGYRTSEQQLALMRDSCENRPGYKSCAQRPARLATCMLRLDDRKSCPHTTGRAVDLLGLRREGGAWRQCVSQQQCLLSGYSLEASAEACLDDPCQAAVVAAMRRAGFCVHALQPWHFEQPALTAACQ